MNIEDRPPLTKYAKEMVSNSKCPRCRKNSMTVGYQCSNCEYDALWIAEAIDEENLK